MKVICTDTHKLEIAIKRIEKILQKNGITLWSPTELKLTWKGSDFSISDIEMEGNSELPRVMDSEKIWCEEEPIGDIGS